MRINGAPAAANRPREHAALQENENVHTNCAQAFVAGLALAMTQKQEVAVRRKLLTNLKIWHAPMVEPWKVRI